ncbi:hypothetical protein J6590_026857 [Homalodisca vitripennis]|nr:hypothetical protein J6590_026857 [Homalodisca vitripennis]
MVAVILLVHPDHLQSFKHGVDILTENEEAAVQRILEVRKILLPMPDDQFDIVVNKTAKQYFPVQAESEMCRDHSNYLLESFLRGDMWALKMFDASSKLVSGVLDGHFYDFGNYKECIRIVEPGEMFRGKHCVVDTTGFLPPEIEEQLRSPGDPYFKKDIVFSICVPSSCSEEDITLHVNRSLAEINVTVYRPEWKGFVDHSHLTCTTGDPISFRIKDYIAMSILLVIVLVVMAGTIYERRYGPKSVLSVFSLSSNFKGLMDTRTPSAEISCLNGLRVIFIIAVLMFSRMRSHILMPSTSLKSVITALDSNTIALFEVIPKAIDGFFLIGGTVLSYGFFCKRQKGVPFNVISFYINRYVRLTAVLALLMLFSCTLAVYLTQGPIWTRMVGSFEKPCQHYWWTGLLHISNYVNPDAVCVSQSWYLASDFQLNIIAPLFLIPLHRRPKIGLLLLGVGIAASVVGATVNAYLRELSSGFMLSEFSASRTSDLSYPMDHKGIHYRLSTFLMGICLGYLVFNVKQNKTTQNVSKRLWQVGWVFCISILAALVAMTVILVDPDHQYSSWLDPLFVGLSRPLFCLSLSWIILACTLGYGGSVNRFLSWAGFRPLARLTYSVYMIHYFSFAYQLYGMQVPLSFSFIDYTYLLGGDLITSCTLAKVLYLAVEKPCCRLATHLLRGKQKRDSLEETHQMSDFKTTTPKASGQQ